MTIRASAPPIGWPLLPLPDEHGEMRFPALEESVRQQIRVLLLTRPGEQLMRPLFGGGVDEFISEPNTLSTRRRIRDRITETLERWEPRIQLDGVEVWDVAERPSHLRVEIAYRLRRTGAAQRIGMVLETEG